MSLAWLISRATEGLASNVWGSVSGLLKIATACTYLPPTWPMTLAYSFSAPIAVMVPLSPDVALPPAAEDDEHPLASTMTASGRAAERTPARVRMTWGLPIWADAPACGASGLSRYDYDNHSH